MCGGSPTIPLPFHFPFSHNPLPKIYMVELCLGAPWADGEDVKRFHAWQSSLLFSAIFVLHLVFSWLAVLSWILFALDIVLIAFLTLRAYKDGVIPPRAYKSRILVYSPCF